MSRRLCACTCQCRNQKSFYYRSDNLSRVVVTDCSDRLPVQLCSAFTPWKFPATLIRCVLLIFLKEMHYFLKATHPRAGQLYLQPAMPGGSRLASFVLSCGHAAERSIAANWELGMKYFPSARKH